MDHCIATIREKPLRKVFSAGGIVFKNHVSVPPLVLLVRHRHAKHWGFPKGHVGDHTPGESFEDAAIREVREEGGVIAYIANPHPIITTYTVSIDGITMLKKVSYYVMLYISGDPHEHDHEIEEADFFPIKKAEGLLTYDIDRTALSQALETLKNT